MTGVRVSGTIHLYERGPSGSSSSGEGFELTTDASGRFAFELTQGWSEGLHRQLSFRPWYDSSRERREPQSEPTVLVDLSRELPLGTCELGDLVLVAPNSPRRWIRYDDDALEDEWTRWRKQRLVNGIHQLECEGLLAEMGRRGGARWIACLERVHAEMKAKADVQEYGQEEVLALPAFRALRRAQGRPDPLRLEVAGGPRIECTFPGLPVLHFTIHNVDAGESLLMQQGGSYRSGRFARLRFDLRRADGKVVAPLPSPSFIGGGMSTMELLAPGESLEGNADMARYVEPPLPEEYRLRLQYHDQEDIDALTDVRPWMVVESDELVLAVSPGRVRLARAEHEGFARDVRAIEATKPVLLTSSTWRPDMEFEGEAEAPEERLFRAGWQALPALLETLADPSLDDAHADWAMGLCFDVTGLNPPGVMGRTVLGSYRWERKWPSSDGPEVQDFGEWDGSDSGASFPEERKAYRERWLDVRKGLVVEFED